MKPDKREPNEFDDVIYVDEETGEEFAVDEPTVEEYLNRLKLKEKVRKAVQESSNEN